MLSRLRPKALAAGAAFVLAASAGTAPASDDRIAAAEKVYKQFCSHCHGPELVNPGTSSFDLRKFPKGEKERFVASVTKGKGAMPPWGDILRPDELELLWLYVSTRAGKEAPPEAEEAPAPQGGATETAAEPATLAPGKLTVCLAVNGGALSSRRTTGGAGLDYAVAEAVADRLGLRLDPLWYESETDGESDPVRATFAMLAVPLCDLVAGHPLYRPALGEPQWRQGRPPRWRRRPLDAGPEPFVALEAIAASAPYRANEIGVVLAPSAGAREVAALDDLQGLSVAVEEGTLAGAILMAAAPAGLRERLRLLKPGPAFLWEMEQGAFEAALVDVAEFDFHRRQNPITELRLAEYRHPLSFNFGFALLAGNEALKAAVDASVTRLVEDGTAARLAEREGVHHAPPRAPAVRGAFGLADLKPGH